MKNHNRWTEYCNNLLLTNTQKDNFELVQAYRKFVTKQK